MEENLTVKELGMRYNIHPHTTNRWRKEFSEYAHNSLPGNGNKKMIDEQRENERLKKEL